MKPDTYLNTYLNYQETIEYMRDKLMYSLMVYGDGFIIIEDNLEVTRKDETISVMELSMGL